MWDVIKRILQKQGGTCIIVEDGRPVYVVTNFEEYEKLLEKDSAVPVFGKAPEQIPPGLYGASVPSASETALLEKINQEIENWKTAQTEARAAEALEKEEEEVKIEDLPV